LSFVFLAPVGRGGSLLNHVLLANHPEIRTTECYVSLNSATNLIVKKNVFAMKSICAMQLTKETSLWALDYQEIGQKSQNFSDHTECVCSRDVSEDSVNLVHVHNLFYDPIQFELFCKLIANDDNCKLILCERDWIQTISSRQRAYPLLDLPRWISILYWIIIEDIARSASQQLSLHIKTLHINLLELHSDPIGTWENTLRFIRVALTAFPMQPKLRGIRWGGGNKNENVVGLNYADYLTTNSLTKHETYTVEFMLKARNSLLSRPIRELIFLSADFVTCLMFLMRAIKVLPKNLRIKACLKCSGSKRNRYSGIQLPIFIERFIDHIRHFRHIVHSGGAYDYRAARKSIRRWNRALHTMYTFTH
jgi:hypothetical protein